MCKSNNGDGKTMEELEREFDNAMRYAVAIEYTWAQTHGLDPKTITPEEMRAAQERDREP